MGSCTTSRKGSPVFPTYVAVPENYMPVLRTMNRLYAGTGKIIATKKSHREPHVFARKGQNGVSPGPRHPGTDSGFEAASLSWSSACSPKAVQRASVGSFCKSARGSRKPSSNGCSSSLINQGLDSSMYARGHMSVLAGSTKKRTNAVPRPALAARRAMLGNAGREAGKCTACWRSAERTSLLVRRGSAPLRGCVATGGLRDARAWPLVSDVLVPAVLSREEHCSDVQCLLHVVQGFCPSATCAATNKRPLPSHCCSSRRWRGKRTHSVETPSEERQGR